jgi:hypothetical protein
MADPRTAAVLGLPVFAMADRALQKAAVQAETVKA